LSLLEECVGKRDELPCDVDDDNLVRLPSLQDYRRTKFGQKSEKLDPAQLELALEDLETAIAETQARTLSRPRWTVRAMPPTVLAQPKGSSIFFRRRWDRA
jgi:hypothetical protein